MNWNLLLVTSFSLLLAGCGGGGGGSNNANNPDNSATMQDTTMSADGSTSNPDTADASEASLSSVFAGLWRGTLSPQLDTCPNPEGTISLDILVEENGDQITLNVPDAALVYTGFTTSENSFMVVNEDSNQCISVATNQPVPGSMSTVVRSFEFSDVSNGIAQVTFVGETSNCSGNSASFDSSCRIVRTGNLMQLG